MLVICFKHEITFLFDKGKSFDLGDNFEFQSTDVIIFFSVSSLFVHFNYYCSLLITRLSYLWSMRTAWEGAKTSSRQFGWRGRRGAISVSEILVFIAISYDNNKSCANYKFLFLLWCARALAQPFPSHFDHFFFHHGSIKIIRRLPAPLVRSTNFGLWLNNEFWHVRVLHASDIVNGGFWPSQWNAQYPHKHTHRGHTYVNSRM